jgi:carbon-monoxide dehydrogenase medium subunit
MKPPPLRLLRPASPTEACALLAEAGDAGRALAGGQSLVPLVNLRLAAPEVLVDLNPLTELATLACGTGALRVGAMVRQRTLERDPLVRRRLPVLPAALAHVGHFATRNRGTIGGSLAHADPAAELPLVAVALGATVELLGPKGPREVPAAELATGFLSTCLEPGELLVACTFPLLGPAEGAGFAEAAPRAGDFALAAACCRLGLDPDGRVAAATVAVGALGPTVQVVPEAAQVLLGSPPGPARFAEAGALVGASDRLDPPASLHASPPYRRHLARLVVEEALAEAARAAQAARNGSPSREDRREEEHGA